MNVVILETCADGHHLVYVRHLAAAVDSWSWVTARGVDASAECAANIAQCPPARIVYGEGAPREHLALAFLLAGATGAQRVIIPDGDRYMWPLLLRSLAFWNRPAFSVFILAMRTTPRSSAARDRLRNELKSVVARLLANRRGITVGFLTDAFGVVVARPGFEGAVAVPDPVDPACIVDNPHSEAPLLRQGKEELTVGIFGTISHQKNPQVLLDAAAADGRTVVRLAGRIEEGLLISLQNSASWRSLTDSGRLSVTNRFLSPDEFAAELGSVDVVAILYSHNAPSGILAESALRGTPAIVAEGGWLAKIVRQLGIGRVSPIEARQLASTLDQFRANRAAFAHSLAQCKSRLGKTAFVEAILGTPA